MPQIEESPFESEHSVIDSDMGFELDIPDLSDDERIEMNDQSKVEFGQFLLDQSSN